LNRIRSAKRWKREKRRRRGRGRRRGESTQPHIHTGHRHTQLTPPLWYRLQERN